MEESELQQLIQIEGVKYGCQVMRNNSGAFKTTEGRWVYFGLGNISKKRGDTIKSSDLIGFTEVRITPEMVGKIFAIFTAIEVKHPNWVYKPSDKRAVAQRAFLDWVRAHGGIAGFCQSIDEFRSWFRR
jgi:hypothetical protein